MALRGKALRDAPRSFSNQATRCCIPVLGHLASTRVPQATFVASQPTQLDAAPYLDVARPPEHIPLALPWAPAAWLATRSADPGDSKWRIASPNLPRLPSNSPRSPAGPEDVRHQPYGPPSGWVPGPPVSSFQGLGPHRPGPRNVFDLEVPPVLQRFQNHV